MRGLRRQRLLAAGLSLLALFAASARIDAERLPITPYGPAEGLASTFIEHVTRDSRGFLWFATRDGLSRFDGLRFVTYGVEHGLANPTINFLLESRAGDYWAATNGGGVCRLDPAAPSIAQTPPDASISHPRPNATLFRCYSVGSGVIAQRVNVLLEDRRGHLWIGSDDGLYRIETPRGRIDVTRMPLDLPLARPEGVNALYEDEAGVIWVGTSWGLIRIADDDARTHFEIAPLEDGDNVFSVLGDGRGGLWLGHRSGLMFLEPPAPAHATRSGATPSQTLRARHARTFDTPVAPPRRRGEAYVYAPARGQVLQVHAIHRTPDGHLWFGSDAGLLEFDGQHFRRFTGADGLSDEFIGTLATDVEGDLWLGTMAGGAMKLTRNGFRSYTTRDGLGDAYVHAVFEDQWGALQVVTGDWQINRFDGRRFAHAQPSLLPDARRGWASQVAFLDRTEGWWFLGDTHLQRLAPGGAGTDLALIQGARPEVVTVGAYVTRLYEDREGDVWMALRAVQRHRLVSWRRQDGSLRAWTAEDGVPDGATPTAFAEDAAGHLWIGLQDGDFLRRTSSGFTRYAGPRGPGGGITSLSRDPGGRLWAGSNRDGLIRIDGPDSAQPRFSAYNKTNSLVSSNVRSVVADRWGRIYAGTASGVDRLDPETSRVRRYTTGDGLISGFVHVAYRDRGDTLWFGSMRGLSRLAPEPADTHTPPRVFIAAVRAPGAPHPLSHLGQAAVSGIMLAPGEGQLQIDFFGLAFGMGETLRYQYRLDGADDQWSAPTDERTVHYFRLPPRAYRFQVRAVRADGTLSAEAATVSFRVLPALWQRAWFQGLALALAGAAAYAAYRVRVGRLLALERVRSRIAGDLHDDIGATLAQIAVLSEVVQTQIDDDHAPLRPPIARIAQTAREAIASMSDIVWAINPRKDSLHEMVRRLRGFANELLPPRGVTVRVTSPAQDVRLGADERRHVYLIIKEALNNVLRHAAATEATVDLRVESRRLRIVITDNGRGFVTNADTDGNGLASMRRRAAALAGTFDVHSRPDRDDVSGRSDQESGTVITIGVPLRRSW